MKIIKVIWGSVEHTKKQISDKFKFDNEVVYVWGIENETYLNSLGYETHLMSTTSADVRYNTQSKKYMHKLLAIAQADAEYDEYLLIDWDTKITLDLDDEFYKLLRSRGKIQCPLYGLPNNFLDVITRKELTNEMKDYFVKQDNFLKKYSWKFDNLHIIPNFSFFYSNNAKIGKELIDIAITNELETNIEEFALYIWANCNLTQWIMEYEPLVCIGQFNDELKEVSFALNEINNYVNLFLNKKVYFNHKNKIKIIRALWGDSLYILNEIPKTPIFENEFVFVWGKANYDFVKKLGYEALLISETKTQGETYDSYLKHFGHKLQALKFADEIFGEYLFLDWDVTLVKKIDDAFYNTIRSKGKLQCPLYGYNQNYQSDTIQYHKSNNTLTDNLVEFIKVHMCQLDMYHWKYEDVKVLPCFCFLYSDNTNIGSDLLNIMNENGMLACIEEFAMQMYSNCSLDEYIEKYEPIVIRGKERDKNLESMTEAIHKINNYINTKVDKNIYLAHDLK